LANHVIVVGGGIAGLTAAVLLARAGRTVTLFEKNRYLGGRAATHQRQGFRFNLGPHALYRTGAAARVLARVGVAVDGRSPGTSGVVLYRGEQHKLPGGLWSLLSTSLLSPRAKAELAGLIIRIRRATPADHSRISIGEWIDASVRSDAVRDYAEALVRLATYANAPEIMSADAALAQLQLAFRKGVLYLHDGWQRLVDSLQSAAVSAGVNFVTSSRVVGVTHQAGAVTGIELGELDEEPLDADTRSLSLAAAMGTAHGTRLRADVVLLAVDPVTAAALIGHHGHVHKPPWRTPTPVRASCLDVALSSLPRPKTTFALGMDEPVYFSVHSRWAHLAPKGGALIHVAKYVGADGISDNAEEGLEALLDVLQPGWREVLVHRRFLPRMIVSNAIVRAVDGGLVARPDVEFGGIRNLYLAGDWVGPEGLLSDASLASSTRAVNRILSRTH
jgi:phytoene dehydrogenase-like protein